MEYAIQKIRKLENSRYLTTLLLFQEKGNETKALFTIS